MRGLQRGGLIGGMLFFALMARPVTAEELFVFADEAALAGAMASLNEMLAHDGAPPDPCHLYILSDQRGYGLFDDVTFASMHTALASGILGSDRADSCNIEVHEVGQDGVNGFLDERRGGNELGLALELSYYKLDGGVTVFATLRGTGGDILSSTGRFDLPVTITTETAASGQTDLARTDVTEAEKKAPSKAALTRKPPVEPVPSTTSSEPAIVAKRPVSASDITPPEPILRRQLVAHSRIGRTPKNPFNLRRVQAGVPPLIKTVRVVDAGGPDTALITDLADGFLTTLATSPGSAVETSDGSASGGRGAELAIEGDPDADVEAIDIQVADTGAAFEQILNNQADIVVTREPISSDAAARFAAAYGVNMRSRYAEHVVAIAASETETPSCGIRYPQNDMLMSTEDHPTSSRVYIYVNPSIPSAVRDRFVDFALSTEGQAVIAGHAVDLRLRLGDAGYSAWRYQTAGELDAEIPDVREHFRDLIRTSQRVSSTFRFDFASADLVLDSRSEQDLENLIQLIKAEDIDSRRILLFGFADSSGAASFNADLSRSRADAVAIRLRLAGIPVPPRNVHGIGEDSPVACNVYLDGNRDELGARKNRRVEVWIES